VSYHSYQSDATTLISFAKEVNKLTHLLIFSSLHIIFFSFCTVAGLKQEISFLFFLKTLSFKPYLHTVGLSVFTLVLLQNCMTTFRGFARFGTNLRLIFRLNTKFPNTRPTLNYALYPNLAKPLLCVRFFFVNFYYVYNLLILQKIHESHQNNISIL
jgi:hypothetical protein